MISPNSKPAEGLASRETAPVPRDVTKEFLTMEAPLFSVEFMRKLRNEQALSITITWRDDDPKLTEHTLIRLKGFMEYPDAPSGQKRTATVRATEAQKNGPVLDSSTGRNAFNSKVRWKKIEEA